MNLDGLSFAPPQTGRARIAPPDSGLADPRVSVRSGTQSIERCVRECAQAHDWRGRWRQQRACQAQLERAGSSPTIARMTAEAAARVGAWIAGAA